MLIMPLQFSDSGLFYSTIILLISCIINYMTCKMYLIHMRDDETEIH
jgi:amino acid permease